MGGGYKQCCACWYMFNLLGMGVGGCSDLYCLSFLCCKYPHYNQFKATNMAAALNTDLRRDAGEPVPASFQYVSGGICEIG